MDPSENKETKDSIMSDIEWNEKIHVRQNLIFDVYIHIILLVI